MTNDLLIEIAVFLVAVGGAAMKIRSQEKRLDSMAGLPERVAVLESGLSGLADQFTGFRTEMRQEMKDYRAETREMLRGIGERLEERVDRIAQRLGEG